MVLVLEVSAHILTIQAALSEPRSIIATDFCKELPYVVWSFRLHKDFTISGRCPCFRCRPSKITASCRHIDRDKIC